VCCCLPLCFRCATAHCALTAPPCIVPPPPVMPLLHHHTSCLDCTAALHAATATLPTVMPPPHSCRHPTAGCRATAVMPWSSRHWVSCHRSRATAITLLPVAPQGAATCCVITVAAVHCTTVRSCHEVPLCMVSPSHCCMSCCGRRAAVCPAVAIALPPVAPRAVVSRGTAACRVVAVATTTAQSCHRALLCSCRRRTAAYHAMALLQTKPKARKRKKRKKGDSPLLMVSSCSVSCCGVLPPVVSPLHCCSSCHGHADTPAAVGRVALLPPASCRVVDASASPWYGETGVWGLYTEANQ